jgi:hypothetical protein
MRAIALEANAAAPPGDVQRYLYDQLAFESLGGME